MRIFKIKIASECEIIDLCNLEFYLIKAVMILKRLPIQKRRLKKLTAKQREKQSIEISLIRILLNQTLLDFIQKSITLIY